MSFEDEEKEEARKDKERAKIRGRLAKKRKPKITPISRDATHFVRFKAANCFTEIDRRLRLGWSTPALVKAVHEEFKELLDVKPSTVASWINSYRSTLSPDERLGSSNSLVKMKAAKELARGLDELSELERLYKIQMERVDIDFNNEKKINKLLNTTGREVFVAMKILRQSAELKMDLGIVKRQIGTMEINGQVANEIGDRYGKESISKVIADPASRKKVLDIAERLFALGAKASIDAVDMINSKPIIEGEAREVLTVEPVSEGLTEMAKE